jgi:Uma2 family endonuclease
MAIVTAPAAPLTYAQLVRLRDKLDDRNRYELINGDLQVTPVPSIEHQWVAGHLCAAVLTYVLERGLGMVFFAPLDVILSDLDVVEPDVLYLTADQVERVTKRAVEEPPTLAIEIISASTARRDRTLKREPYQRYGVPHYWIADPKRCTLDVHEPSDGRYQHTTSLRGNAEFRPNLFLAEAWPPPRLRAL